MKVLQGILQPMLYRASQASVQNSHELWPLILWSRRYPLLDPHSSQYGNLSYYSLTLDLGAKNAFLIFDVADLGRAISDSLEGTYLNIGESYIAASRFLVHSSIHGEFVRRLKL